MPTLPLTRRRRTVRCFSTLHGGQEKRTERSAVPRFQRAFLALSTYALQIPSNPSAKIPPRKARIGRNTQTILYRCCEASKFLNLGTIIMWHVTRGDNQSAQCQTPLNTIYALSPDWFEFVFRAMLDMTRHWQQDLEMFKLEVFRKYHFSLLTRKRPWLLPQLSNVARVEDTFRFKT
jgi:hypothetical protein